MIIYINIKVYLINNKCYNYDNYVIIGYFWSDKVRGITSTDFIAKEGTLVFLFTKQKSCYDLTTNEF